MVSKLFREMKLMILKSPISPKDCVLYLLIFFIFKGDISNPILVNAQNTSSTLALEWSPDGNEIAIATNTGVQIYDVNSQSTISLFGYSQQVISLSWSPSGNYLAAVGYPYDYSASFLYVPMFTSSLLIWQKNSNGQFSLIEQVDYSSQVNIVEVEWSPDGTKLATRESEYLPQSDIALGSVTVWDVTSFPITSVSISQNTYKEWYGELTWSPDSARIASGAQATCYEPRPCNNQSNDPVGTIVFILDALTGERLFYAYTGASVSGISWSNNGQIAVASTGYQIYNNDLSVRLVEDTKYAPLGVKWINNDTELLVWSYSDINIVAVEDFQSRYSQSYISSASTLETISLSPDNKRIAVIENNQLLEIYVLPSENPCNTAFKRKRVIYAENLIEKDAFYNNNGCN